MAPFHTVDAETGGPGVRTYHPDPGVLTQCNS